MALHSKWKIVFPFCNYLEITKYPYEFDYTYFQKIGKKFAYRNTIFYKLDEISKSMT